MILTSCAESRLREVREEVIDKHPEVWLAIIGSSGILESHQSIKNRFRDFFFPFLRRSPLCFLLGTGKDGFPDETVGISEALISACAMGPYGSYAER